ncbi:MAG: hypothetical protein PHQ23_17495, partial [Candidatus Wallbacteria bacterium]|nr:hypothetical protein [Candidatus Wallbacteria bacterium]
SLKLELAIWGDMMFGDPEELLETCRMLIGHQAVDPFLSSALPVIGEKFRPAILGTLFQEAGEQNQKLLQARIGMELVNTGRSPVNRRDIVHLLLEFNEFQRALDYITSSCAPADYLEELRVIYSKTGYPLSLHHLLAVLSGRGEWDEVRRLGETHFGDRETFTSWLGETGLQHIRAVMLCDTPDVDALTDSLDCLCRDQNWDLLDQAVEMLLRQGKKGVKIYRYYRTALDRSPSKAALERAINSFLSGLEAKERIELHISLEHFEFALTECRSLMESGYPDTGFLQRKLDEIRFRRYMKSHDEIPDVSLCLARIHRKSGEPLKALTEYERYLSTGKPVAEVVCEVIELCRKYGDKSKLPGLTGLLLEIDPGNKKYQELHEKFTGESVVKKLYRL